MAVVSIWPEIDRPRPPSCLALVSCAGNDEEIRRGRKQARRAHRGAAADPGGQVSGKLNVDSPRPIRNETREPQGTCRGVSQASARADRVHELTHTNTPKLTH